MRGSRLDARFGRTEVDRPRRVDARVSRDRSVSSARRRTARGADRRANGERRSEAVVSLVPGPRRAWLVVGPSHGGSSDPRALTLFLLPVVAQYLQSALEVEHAANELAERYEEINLLYTISEILGRTVSLEEATKTILREVSETVGARRASVLVADRAPTRCAPSPRSASIRPTCRPSRSTTRAASARACSARDIPRCSRATNRSVPRRRATAAARCSPCRSCGRRPPRASRSRSAS